MVETCTNHPDTPSEWPTTAGGLCQECWEAVCAEEFWGLLEKMEKMGVLR